MAMVANSPMITTTMSSSIRVKPFRDITADPLRAPKGAEPVSPWLGATYSGRRASFLQEPCLPLRINPIHSQADTYDQGDAQPSGSLHMAFYHLRGSFLLPDRHLKYKLVMDLQDHARRKAPFFQGPRDADHRDLDQIRGRALERGVRGRALAEGSDVVIAVLELRDVTPPSE